MAYKWMPEILENACTGCGLCVDACGPKSLAMDDEVAVLAFPDTCGSEEHCISACPGDAIQMRWLLFSGNRAVGRWNIETSGAGHSCTQLDNECNPATAELARQQPSTFVPD